MGAARRQKGTDTGEKRDHPNPNHYAYSELDSSLDSIIYKRHKILDGAYTHCPTRGPDDLNSVWQEK